MFRTWAMSVAVLLVGMSCDALQAQQYPVLPANSLHDSMYDFEVWSADSTAGQFEFVIWGRVSGSWDLVHRYAWVGSPDQGFSLSDRGVYRFSTWWRAFQHAENLLDDGDIDEYFIEQVPVPPNWQYLETFSTRGEAEEFAALIEQLSASWNAPQQTKIVPVSVFSHLFYRR